MLIFEFSLVFVYQRGYIFISVLVGWPVRRVTQRHWGMFKEESISFGADADIGQLAQSHFQSLCSVTQTAHQTKLHLPLINMWSVFSSHFMYLLPSDKLFWSLIFTLAKHNGHFKITVPQSEVIHYYVGLWWMWRVLKVTPLRDMKWTWNEQEAVCG